MLAPPLPFSTAVVALLDVAAFTLAEVDAAWVTALVFAVCPVLVLDVTESVFGSASLLSVEPHPALAQNPKMSPTN